MIKKYNQFVEKLNEDYSPEPQRSPSPSTPDREVETMPGTPSPSTRPRPSRPSVVPGRKPSEEDAPLAFFDEEEEEEVGDIYSSNLSKLAIALGLSKSDIVNNELEYEGKKIIFPSETHKFHVDRKKFNTVQSVVRYLTNKAPKLSNDRVDPEFEAKSYRFSRKDRLK